jgi:predicted phosphodiesterase
MILWYIKARMEGRQGLKFCKNEIDDEIIVTNILGNTIFAAHGHKDKPAKAVEQLSLLLRKFPDMVLLGHFHSAAEREVQGAELIVNGSLCGTDSYAFNLRKTSHPSQKFIVLSKQGRECTYNLRLA